MFMYTGIYLPPPPTVVSPNGDGVDEEAGLSYKVVRPSTVTVTIRAPDGSVAYTETTTLDPGAHPIPFPPPAAPPPEEVPPAAAPAARRSASAQAAPANGRWKVRVDATDDVGQVTSMARAVRVNTTLGFVRTERKRLYLPPTGRELGITWRLDRPARVTVRVETRDGTLVRKLGRLRYTAGDQAVVWNGLGLDGKPVKGGAYVARVVAANGLGRIELTARFAVQRVAVPKARPAS